MSNIKSYKCPACGGALYFDSSAQKLKCTYCSEEYPIDMFQEKQQEDLSTLKTNNNWEEEIPMYDSQDEFEEIEEEELTPIKTDEEMKYERAYDSLAQAGMSSVKENSEFIRQNRTLKLYVCDSCGGEILAEHTLGATTCPFCGNNVVLKNTFVNDFKPDALIPFQITKEKVVEIFNEHLKDKVLLPKRFKELNYIEEIKGVYIPFWIFDSKADIDLKATGIIVKSYSKGDYNYKETHFYDVARGASLDFNDVPVDGSKAIDNAMMESLEPFDTKKAVPYSPAYLSGYFANRYDVDRDECISRAEERMRKSAEEQVKITTKQYTRLEQLNIDCKLTDKNAQYVLFPVYLMTVSYNGANYQCAVNGQTGKFVGNLPVDMAKYWLIYAGMFGICSTVAGLVLYLILG